MARCRSCVKCGKATADLKLLPCLHVCCGDCLLIGGAETETASLTSGIFSCPTCQFRIRLPKSGLNGLKNIPAFLTEKQTRFATDIKPPCIDQKCDENAANSESETAPAENNHCLSTPNNDADKTDVKNGLGHTEENCSDKEHDSKIHKQETGPAAEEDNHNDPVFDADAVPAPGEQTDKIASYPCSSCEVIISKDSSAFCNECDCILCLECQNQKHAKHTCSSMTSFVQNKMDYILNLLQTLKGKKDRHDTKISCISRVREHLKCLKRELEDEVISRAKYLLDVIEKRKQCLLNELEEVYKCHMESYDLESDRMAQQMQEFQNVQEFGDLLLEEGGEEDFVEYHTDVTNHCHYLIHQVPEPALNILSLKLDIPDKGKEHASLEKLFGSLMQGAIRCGNADLIASFNVDLKWPTSIAVTKGKEMVIGGKTGTFDSQGKILFFDKFGQNYFEMDLNQNSIPLDIKAEPDGGVLLSNRAGKLLRLSSAGRVVQTHENRFHGGGQFGVFTDGSVIVASLEQSCYNLYTAQGEAAGSLSAPLVNSVKQTALTPHAVVTNSNDDIIVSDVKNRQVVSFDKQGTILLQYTGYSANDSEANTSDNNRKKIVQRSDSVGSRDTSEVKSDYNENQERETCRQSTNQKATLDQAKEPPETECAADDIFLKCPSAVCCDPFNNLLVADFTNDNVHLVSKTGQFLGHLLTKDNGLSCPNCLVLDREGRLIIGQYGGDVLVFQYLSYIKHA